MSQRCSFVLSLFVPVASAGVSAQQPVAAKPLQAMPFSPTLDVSSLDKTVDPCTDFYKYSCGGWMKNNPIPADQAGWSVYGKLADENQQFLWGILEADAKATQSHPGAAEGRRLLRRLHGYGSYRQARASTPIRAGARR